MIWVTLKNGEVRRYNNGTVYHFDDGWLLVGSGKPIHEHVVCRIRENLVERVEFQEPCHITRNTNLTQTLLESALRVVLTGAREHKNYLPESDLLCDLKKLMARFNVRTRTFKP